MPQIPVYTPNQRIDASTPVAAIDTRSARMMGDATAAFGDAIADLGTVLENQAQKAGRQLQKNMVGQAVMNARVKGMTRAAERQQEELDPTDKTGTKTVEQFQATYQQDLSEIAESLPVEARSAFYEETYGDVVKFSSTVLASEVDKREKGVMASRQGNINKRAALVRQDPGTLDLALAEQTKDLAEDEMIPDSMKSKAILDANQNAIKSAAQGMMLKGQFGQAEKLLTDPKYAQFFSADDMAKEVNRVQTERDQKSNQVWNDDRRRRQRFEDKEKDRRDAVLDQMIATMSVPGQSAEQAAIQLQTKTFGLPSGLRNNLLDRQALGIAENTVYESAVMDRYVRGENVLDNIRADQDKGNVSVQHGQYMIQNIKALDQAKQNPLFRKSFEESQKIIENFKEPRLFDAETGAYKEADEVTHARTKAMFIAEAAKLAQKGQATPENLEQVSYSVLRTQYASQATKLSVAGVPDDALESTKTIQQAVNDIAKRRRAGEFNTPEKEAEATRQVQGLILNQTRAKFREELAKHPAQNTRNK